LVSPVSLRLYRASLRAYPRAFRREYESALLQSLIDQHRAEGTALWRVAVREIADVAATAPRMRGESPMTRVVLAVGALTVCIAAAVATGPLAVLAVLAASAAIWFGFARSTPTAEHVAGHGASSAWLVAGIVALAGAITIPVVDGGELPEMWWSVMAALILAGTALLVTAAVKYASKSAYRPTP
jgi:hypothetical protein